MQSSNSLLLTCRHIFGDGSIVEFCQEEVTGWVCVSQKFHAPTTLLVENLNQLPLQWQSDKNCLYSIYGVLTSTQVTF